MPVSQEVTILFFDSLDANGAYSQMIDMIFQVNLQLGDGNSATESHYCY